MLLFFFFAVLGVCFLLLMVLLKPSAAAERVSLRLSALGHRRSFSKRAEDKDADLQPSQNKWRIRIEARLLALPAGRRLANLLLQTRSRHTLSTFLAISASAAICAGVLANVAYGHLVCVCCAIIGGSVYGLLLVFRRSRRMDRFADQLPATAVMMARALRAGHSVSQMMELAAEQAKTPLREDFEHLVQEQRLGVPLREALHNLTRRVPLPDLRFLISAISIQRETGGDLIQILERTAALMEDRMRLRRQVQTFTAQGCTSGWILTALPVALLLLLSVAMPGYARTLFHDPAGQWMLLTGVVLLVVGGFVIRRIVSIEV
jgi:tight adherence protein B